MVDSRFSFEIYRYGNFAWNPDLVYVGGKVSFVYNVNPDLLSYFEIQDVSKCTTRFHNLIPGDILE